MNISQISDEQRNCDSLMQELIKNWSCDQGYSVLSLPVPHSANPYLFHKQQSPELIIEFAVQDNTFALTVSCLRWLFFFQHYLSKVNKYQSQTVFIPLLEPGTSAYSLVSFFLLANKEPSWDCLPVQVHAFPWLAEMSSET